VSFFLDISSLHSCSRLDHQFFQIMVVLLFALNIRNRRSPSVAWSQRRCNCSIRKIRRLNLYLLFEYVDIFLFFEQQLVDLLIILRMLYQIDIFIQFFICYVVILIIFFIYFQQLVILDLGSFIHFVYYFFFLFINVIDFFNLWINKNLFEFHHFPFLLLNRFTTLIFLFVLINKLAQCFVYEMVLYFLHVLFVDLCLAQLIVQMFNLT